MGELRWDERVAVVTGAGRGLGREYAVFLASRGARVVVNDLGIAVSDTTGAGDAPAMNPALEVVDQIVAAGGTAVADVNSVATEAGGRALVATALDTWGRIDVLINNAGVVRQAPFEDMDPSLLDPVIESHIGGAFNVTRPAWRAMKDQGFGRVLNLSSGAGLFGVPGMAGYAAAKLGIVGLTRSLSQEGAGHGINVNVIAPYAATRPGRGFGPLPPSTDLDDWLSPSLVAPVAAWLVHESCAVSGECFSVGAGYVARVVVAVNEGFRQRPLTAEDVRDRFNEVMDDEEPYRAMPAGTGDLGRIMKGFLTPRS